MIKNRIICLAIISTFVLSMRFGSAQSWPVSGLYRITSGSYIECCGFIGSDVVTALPNENQGFVKLTVDPQRNVSMTFLAEDMQTVFSIIPCPGPAAVNFSFSYGLVFSNAIIFHVDPGPPPYSTYWNYTVTNSANALRIDGTLETAQPLCADVPTRFSHSNVVAVLIPMATVRMSEVEVCWGSVSNASYQVQYRAALDTNAWTNLGPPVAGNGSMNCVTDKTPVGESQRFYRVIMLP